MFIKGHRLSFKSHLESYTVLDLDRYCSQRRAKAYGDGAIQSKGRFTAMQTNSITSQSDQTDELLTTAEVAAYLKLSQRTAWRWCKDGRLPAFKVGRHGAWLAVIWRHLSVGEAGLVV